MTKHEYNEIMGSLDEIRGELRSLSLFAAQGLLRTSLMLPEPQVFVQSALLNIGSNLMTMNSEVPEGDESAKRTSLWALAHFEMLADQIRKAIETVPTSKIRTQ